MFYVIFSTGIKIVCLMWNRGNQEARCVADRRVWMVVRWLSGDCQVVVRWLSGDCQVTVRWLSGDCQVIVAQWSRALIVQVRGSGIGSRWLLAIHFALYRPVYCWKIWSWFTRLLASFPGLPRFNSLVCIQYNTRKRNANRRTKTGEAWEQGYQIIRW